MPSNTSLQQQQHQQQQPAATGTNQHRNNQQQPAAITSSSVEQQHRAATAASSSQQQQPVGAPSNCSSSSNEQQQTAIFKHCKLFNQPTARSSSSSSAILKPTGDARGQSPCTEGSGGGEREYFHCCVDSRGRSTSSSKDSDNAHCAHVGEGQRLDPQHPLLLNATCTIKDTLLFPRAI